MTNDSKQKAIILKIGENHGTICCVKFVESDGGRLEANRLLTIKFEDLLSKPHEVTDKIYSHIGLCISKDVENSLSQLTRHTNCTL